VTGYSECGNPPHESAEPHSEKGTSRDLEALLRMKCPKRAALAKIKMRLKGMASGEACNIVTRTRLSVSRSFGEQRHVKIARTGVGNRSVGHNREFRNSGRRCWWNDG
jgi:hypothetical protein